MLDFLDIQSVAFETVSGKWAQAKQVGGRWQIDGGES